jgi:3-methyladenine DNA glycosylase/8-oxoguanine DNA glycosylase
LAEKVVSGEFDLEGLNELSSEEICRALSSLEGIGVWTAEMLMIFSMQRPDVFSFGDLAIHRGLRMVYRHRKITRELFEKYRRRYAPYCSVASLYLWHIAGGACGLTDPASN